MDRTLQRLLIQRRSDERSQPDGCVSTEIELVVNAEPSCCPGTPTSTTWSTWKDIYGCGVAIEAAEAEIPIRTLRNISFNPNFGGGTMVVSLGCEKLQPDRLLPISASFPYSGQAAECGL